MLFKSYVNFFITINALTGWPMNLSGFWENSIAINSKSFKRLFKKKYNIKKYFYYINIILSELLYGFIILIGLIF